MDATTVINFVPATPEIFVLIMACFSLLMAAFSKKNTQVIYFLVQITLVVTFALTIRTYMQSDHAMPVIAFYGMFVLDYLAMLLKCVICAVVFFTLLYARYYNDERQILRAEYYILALLSTLGMMILVSAHHLLILYLGLELFSLPTYAMVAMHRGSFKGIEAGMKYFIISAIASGILLYGFSFLFGVTHSFDIGKIAQLISSGQLANEGMLLVAMVFIVSGVAFKLGTVPFQMWVPDVYDGAPTSTTLFIAAAPKLAAFAMAIRLFVTALPQTQAYWQWILIAISILSMLIGNFAAIMQSKIKRLLAYSSIAHMGYMLLGIISGIPLGYSASLFYVISYAVMTLAGFGIILLMSHNGVEIDTIDDFTGLSDRSPWLAFLMLIVMFSMAGVPPLVGFIAKVHLLEALVQVHLVWLAVVTLLFSVVGVYYYLRIIQRMYFQQSEIILPIHYEFDTKVAITINGLIILFLGIFPNALFVLAKHAFSF